ncbi:MAG: thioredoxin family protein [Gemmatimonadaceae bacterium]|nr:thioredoxin family protein [Gemmatimonadaceae bacterium]
MLVAALLASLVTCHPVAVPAPAVLRPVAAAGDSVLRTLYERGQTFAAFVEQATARREGWVRLQREATIAPTLLERARAVGGTWQLLVIAIDRCGDSMNSVPYAARLADSVPGLSLRIVLPAAGRAVQESHRSLDGRTATPTLVLLDGLGNDVGCLVELPAPLRQWNHKHRGVVSDDSLHAYRDAFYAKDRGESLVTELVELLEAAKAGTPRCDRQQTR